MSARDALSLAAAVSTSLGFIVAQPEVETIGGELADYSRMTVVTRTQLTDARDAVDLMAAALAASAGNAGSGAEPVALPAAGESPVEWHVRTPAPPVPPAADRRCPFKSG